MRVLVLVGNDEREKLVDADPVPVDVTVPESEEVFEGV